MSDKIVSSIRNNFRKVTIKETHTLKDLISSLISAENGKVPSFVTKAPISSPDEEEQLRSELKNRTKNEFKSLYNYLVDKESILRVDYYANIISEIIYRSSEAFPDARFIYNKNMTQELLRILTTHDNYLFSINDYAIYVNAVKKKVDQIKGNFPMDDFFLGFDNFYTFKDKISLKYNKDGSRTLSNKETTGFIKNFKHFLAFLRTSFEKKGEKTKVARYFGLLDINLSFFFVKDTSENKLIIVAAIMFNDAYEVESLMSTLGRIRMEQVHNKLQMPCNFDYDGIVNLYTNYLKMLYNPNVIHSMFSSYNIQKSFLNKADSTPLSFSVEKLDDNIWFNQKNNLNTFLKTQKYSYKANSNDKDEVEKWMINANKFMQKIIGNEHSSAYVFILPFEKIINKFLVELKVKLSESNRSSLAINRSKIIESIHATLFVQMLEYDPLFGKEVIYDYKKVKKVSIGHQFFMDSPEKIEANKKILVPDMSLVIIMQIIKEKQTFNIDRLQIANNLRVKIVDESKTRIVEKFAELNKDFGSIGKKYDIEVSRIMRIMNPQYKLMIFKDYQTDLKAYQQESLGLNQTGIMDLGRTPDKDRKSPDQNKLKFDSFDEPKANPDDDNLFKRSDIQDFLSPKKDKKSQDFNKQSPDTQVNYSPKNLEEIKQYKRSKSVSSFGRNKNSPRKGVIFDTSDSKSQQSYKPNTDKKSIDQAKPVGILKTPSMSLKKYEKDYRDQKDGDNDYVDFNRLTPKKNAKGASSKDVPMIKNNFGLNIIEEEKDHHSVRSVKSILKKSKFESDKEWSNDKDSDKGLSYKSNKLDVRKNDNQRLKTSVYSILESEASDNKKTESLIGKSYSIISPQKSKLTRESNRLQTFEELDKSVNFSRPNKFRNSMVKLNQKKGQTEVDFYNYQFNESEEEWGDYNEFRKKPEARFEESQSSSIGGFENYQKVGINVFDNGQEKNDEDDLNYREATENRPKAETMNQYMNARFGRNQEDRKNFVGNNFEAFLLTTEKDQANDEVEKKEFKRQKSQLVETENDKMNFVDLVSDLKKRMKTQAQQSSPDKAEDEQEANFNSKNTKDKINSLSSLDKKEVQGNRSKFDANGNKNSEFQLKIQRLEDEGSESEEEQVNKKETRFANEISEIIGISPRNDEYLKSVFNPTKVKSQIRAKKGDSSSDDDMAPGFKRPTSSKNVDSSIADIVEINITGGYDEPRPVLSFRGDSVFLNNNNKGPKASNKLSQFPFQGEAEDIYKKFEIFARQYIDLDIIIQKCEKHVEAATKPAYIKNTELIDYDSDEGDILDKTLTKYLGFSNILSFETISEVIAKNGINYRLIIQKYIPSIQKSNKLVSNFNEIIMNKETLSLETDIDKSLYDRMRKSKDDFFEVINGNFHEKVNVLLEIIFELFNRNWMILYNIVIKQQELSIQVKFLKICVESVYRFNESTCMMFLGKIIEDTFEDFLNFFFTEMVPLESEYFIVNDVAWKLMINKIKDKCPPAILCLTAMRFFFKNTYGESFSLGIIRSMQYMYVYEYSAEGKEIDNINNFDNGGDKKASTSKPKDKHKEIQRVILGSTTTVGLIKVMNVFEVFKELYTNNLDEENQDFEKQEQMLAFRAVIEYIMANLEMFILKNNMGEVNRTVFFVFFMLYVIVFPNLLEPFKMMYKQEELLKDFLFMKPEILSQEFVKFRYISNFGTFATYYEFLETLKYVWPSLLFHANYHNINIITSSLKNFNEDLKQLSYIHRDKALAKNKRLLKEIKKTNFDFSNTKFANDFGKNLIANFEKIIRSDWMHSDHITLINIDDFEFIIDRMLGFQTKKSKTNIGDCNNLFQGFSLTESITSTEPIFTYTNKYFTYIMMNLVEFRIRLKDQLKEFKTKFQNKSKSLNIQIFSNIKSICEGPAEYNLLEIYSKSWKRRTEDNMISQLMKELSPMKNIKNSEDISIRPQNSNLTTDFGDLATFEEFCKNLVFEQEPQIKKQKNFQSCLSNRSHYKQMFKDGDRIFMETLSQDRLLKIGPNKIFTSFYENLDVYLRWHTLETEDFKDYLDEIKFTTFKDNFSRLIDLSKTDLKTYIEFCKQINYHRWKADNMKKIYKERMIFLEDQFLKELFHKSN